MKEECCFQVTLLTVSHLAAILFSSLWVISSVCRRGDSHFLSMCNLKITLYLPLCTSLLLFTLQRNLAVLFFPHTIFIVFRRGDSCSLVIKCLEIIFSSPPCRFCPCQLWYIGDSPSSSCELPSVGWNGDDSPSMLMVSLETNLFFYHYADFSLINYTEKETHPLPPVTCLLLGVKETSHSPC